MALPFITCVPVSEVLSGPRALSPASPSLAALPPDPPWHTLSVYSGLCSKGDFKSEDSPSTFLQRAPITVYPPYADVLAFIVPFAI